MDFYLSSIAKKREFYQYLHIKLSLNIFSFKYIELTAKEIGNVKANILFD